MRKLFALLLMGGVLGNLAICASARADDKEGAKASEEKDKDSSTTKRDDSNDKNRRIDHMAYVGMGIEPLHPAMLRHLPQLLRDGRGIMVTEVAEDSPAAKAGIKPHDVILNYDDQKLYSPEQLVKLIRHDKPGREVKIGLIHDGKATDVTVTLGEHQGHNHMRDGAHARRMLRGPMADRIRSQLASDSDSMQNWTSFDSMSITRLDDHRFKAEVKYRDDKGKVESRTFEGTHDELRKAIEAQKDLPEAEREHLLRALNLPGHAFELDLPGVRIIPGAAASSSTGL